MMKILPLPVSQDALAKLIEQEVPNFKDKECLACKQPANGLGVFVLPCVCGCEKHLNVLFFSLCVQCRTEENRRKFQPYFQEENQKYYREINENLN